MRADLIVPAIPATGSSPGVVAGAAVRSGAVGDTLLRIMSGSLRHDEFGTPETVARLATTVLTVAPEA
mgnify:CR=1 FL=1